MPGETTSATAECRRLCRYLVDESPPPAIVEAYLRAREAVAPDDRGTARIDRLLSRAAQSGRLGLALADAYASRFRPATPLRQRLTLLCAILESAPPAHARMTRGPSTSPLGAVARIGVAVTRHGLLLLTAALVFGPVHLTGGRRSAATPSTS